MAPEANPSWHNKQMHRTAALRCSFESAGSFGRWIRSQSPFPAAVGDLGRSAEMFALPQNLVPTCEEVISLPSSAALRIPKVTPRFRAWRDKIPFDRYGKKAVLNFRGQPLFAELVILRLFEEAGWTGAWVDTYGRCFRRDAGSRGEIPAEKLRLLERVYGVAGARSGCFDVFVWTEDAVVFAESKRLGRDQIRLSQVRWLDAALRCGIPVESLLIVEWSFEEEPNQALLVPR